MVQRVFSHFVAQGGTRSRRMKRQVWCGECLAQRTDSALRLRFFRFARSDQRSSLRCAEFHRDVLRHMSLFAFVEPDLSRAASVTEMNREPARNLHAEHRNH